MFREPGPCAACGVSIVSILSTDNKTPHSNVKCPFRQLSLYSVRSLHNVHRASQPRSGVALETYFPLECGDWDSTECGLAGHCSLDGSPVPQSPVWRQSGLVVWRRLMCSVDCADAHLRHRTSDMAHAPRALRTPAARGRAAGGGRRSLTSHMSELSRAKLVYNVLKTLETRVAQGCQGVHGLFVLLRIIRRGRIGFHATPRAQERKVER